MISVSSLQPDQSLNHMGILYMIIGSACYGASFVYGRKFYPSIVSLRFFLLPIKRSSLFLVMSFFIDFHSLTDIVEHPKALLGATLGMGVLGTGIACT